MNDFVDLNFNGRSIRLITARGHHIHSHSRASVSTTTAPTGIPEPEVRTYLVPKRNLPQMFDMHLSQSFFWRGQVDDSLEDLDYSACTPDNP